MMASFAPEDMPVPHGAVERRFYADARTQGRREGRGAPSLVVTFADPLTEKQGNPGRR
jgi:hypothetical protein